MWVLHHILNPIGARDRRHKCNGSRLDKSNPGNACRFATGWHNLPAA